MPKKPLIKRKYIIIFFLIFITICVCLWGICLKATKFRTYICFSENILFQLIFIQITISLISITIMQLFLGNSNERVLGFSYKGIFFNDFFFKLNAMNCIWYELFLAGLSIFGGLIYTVQCSSVILFSKIMVVVSLVLTVFFTLRMVQLSLISKHKVSQIYFRIYHMLAGKSPVIYNETFKRIMGSIDMDIPDKKVSEYRPYISDEFCILTYIYLHIGKFVPPEQHSKTKEFILKKINSLIDTDIRTRDIKYGILFREVEKWPDYIETKQLLNQLYYMPEHTGNIHSVTRLLNNLLK